jgi:hypothetical protein
VLVYCNENGRYEKQNCKDFANVPGYPVMFCVDTESKVESSLEAGVPRKKIVKFAISVLKKMVKFAKGTTTL